METDLQSIRDKVQLPLRTFGVGGQKSWGGGTNGGRARRKSHRGDDWASVCREKNGFKDPPAAGKWLHGTLGTAMKEKVGDLAEAQGAIGVRLEGSYSLSGKITGNLMRALEAKNRRIGGFLLGDVLACGFAESGGGLFHVEDVIRDLEGPAYRFAEVAEARNVSLGCPGTDRTGSD